MSTDLATTSSEVPPDSKGSPSEEYHEHFNDADGDVVLKSSDGTKFRTYALLLRLSSSFFRTMLDLPQPAASHTQGAVLLLDEDAGVIANVLTVISGKAFSPQLVRLFDVTVLYYISNHM